MTYGVISDTHHHSWSAFATTDADGVNSRLKIILDQTWRAAKATADAGGTILFHAGDLFHVRGSIAPSVLNPTLDLYHKITSELRLDVIILAGNHDMESRESSRVSNAVTAMERVGCTVVHEPTVVLTSDGPIYMIPWTPNIETLKKLLEEDAPPPARARATTTVILHAPIDGVIAGIPDHGLSPEYLASLGYKAILCGHYHSHKVFPGNVCSIGALTHQTWNDVGAKAGHLWVHDGHIEYHAATSPRFVELDDETMADEAALLDRVDGNYVRVKLRTNKADVIEAARQLLERNGALGVNVLAEPAKSSVERTESAVASGATLEASTNAYIAKAGFADPAAVARLCSEILSDARFAA
jgi:DNA repair exonuclease SbcCD nuclease subunit